MTREDDMTSTAVAVKQQTEAVDHKAVAQARKAQVLAAILRQSGATATSVTREQWNLAMRIGQASGKLGPSAKAPSATTRVMILDLLAHAHDCATVYGATTITGEPTVCDCPGGAR